MRKQKLIVWAIYSAALLVVAQINAPAESPLQRQSAEQPTVQQAEDVPKNMPFVITPFSDPKWDRMRPKQSIEWITADDLIDDGVIDEGMR